MVIYENTKEVLVDANHSCVAIAWYADNFCAKFDCSTIYLYIILVARYA